MGAMAEWLSQSTVNTFFRGSSPLGAFALPSSSGRACFPKDPRDFTNMLKFGKQSSFKQKWEKSLKSSSLFVRIVFHR